MPCKKHKQHLNFPGVFLLLSYFDCVVVVAVVVVVVVAVVAVVVTFPMGSIYRIISLNLVEFYYNRQIYWDVHGT